MCHLQGNVIPTPDRNMKFSVIEPHVVKLIWNRVGVPYEIIHYYVHCRLQDLEPEDQDNPAVITGNYPFERPPLQQNVCQQML